MSKFLKISAAIAGLGLVVGCAPLPTVAIPCATCGPEAVYGIAVIQQLMSNRMFPLTLKGLEDAMRMMSK